MEQRPSHLTYFLAGHLLTSTLTFDTYLRLVTAGACEHLEATGGQRQRARHVVLTTTLALAWEQLLSLEGLRMCEGAR